MDTSDLAKRMKAYEGVSQKYLMKRVPVIVRVDGKAFHTLTRKHFRKRGFDWSFSSMMSEVASTVMEEMQGCDFCYSQSDEISFLLTDYRTIRTSPWFDYRIDKLNSITAALASVSFSRLINDAVCFDCRCFNLPKDDVCNYFIWRQKDAIRNAVQMCGQERFSKRELHGKSCIEIKDMLFSCKGIDFDELSDRQKQGFCIHGKDRVFLGTALFSENRELVEKFVNVRED